MHPCDIIYNFSDKVIYGNEVGVCRVTGNRCVGLNFNKWVKQTFNDYSKLYDGEIISNQALFCFEEQSEFIAQKVGKDKPQRFRNYTHIVTNDTWYVLSKAQKNEIYNLIINHEPLICVIAESGQKHLLFKHKIGTWQFEEHHIMRNKETLGYLIGIIDRMLSGGFSKYELSSGAYKQHRILNYGMENWREDENGLNKHRGSKLFDLAVFLSQGGKNEG